MAWYKERSAEDKLAQLIGYLVRTFPLASVLSRQVGDRYHVFVIVPFDGSREKTLQVETTLFHDHRLGAKRFSELLAMLNLRSVFNREDRYDLEWYGRPSEVEHTPSLRDGSLLQQLPVQALVMN